MSETDELTGTLLPDWKPKAFPSRTSMVGTHCALEILNVDQHGQGLYEADSLDHTGASWTYLPYGPFESRAQHAEWLNAMASTEDPQFFAVINPGGRPVGVLSFQRIQPMHGVLEIGHVHFSPRLRRTTAATEAIALMLTRTFDELGYRRCEWKCNDLNVASKRAALRLGFQHEGLFRQAAVMKGRSRDTAWYSMLDSEWPLAQQAFGEWLAPRNFDRAGQQCQTLSAIRSRIESPRDGSSASV
jgi:RimJ/RimL family protein N-acetyltransferase